MTLVANLYSDFRFGGSSGEGVTANAGYLGLWMPLWMYFYLHGLL
jgi:hypothetical protein